MCIKTTENDNEIKCQQIKQKSWIFLKESPFEPLMNQSLFAVVSAKVLL